MTESQEQIAIFQWAEFAKGKHPELSLLHAIPNGGLRTARTAGRLKREGVKPGVPDICLPVARAKWHGLYIELKAAKGKVSENQKAWIDALIQQGYFTSVCFGSATAIEIIEEYLNLKGCYAFHVDR
jgi:hypothetical protein